MEVMSASELLGLLALALAIGVILWHYRHRN
jgi:hypothetical protein